MERYCVLFNPRAGNGQGAEDAERLCAELGNRVCEKLDVTTLTQYEEFFASHREEAIVLCGGDGTLNHFVNDTVGLTLPSELYYCGTGTGNDFLRDIGRKAGELIPLTPYIKRLPICEIDGKTYRFVNGVGYGIDGYCCEEGDRQRAKGTGKPINYTAIAIQGLLFHYRPTGATVTVDGVSRRFEKVWIAPTMNGRYYGGGMMAAPTQNRLSEEHTVSLMLFFGAGKIHTLSVFPKIFKGEHLKSKITELLVGREITVEFDEPRPAQIDGETLLGVKKYSVSVPNMANQKEKVEATAEI